MYIFVLFVCTRFLYLAGGTKLRLNINPLFDDLVNHWLLISFQYYVKIMSKNAISPLADSITQVNLNFGCKEFNCSKMESRWLLFITHNIWSTYRQKNFNFRLNKLFSNWCSQILAITGLAVDPIASPSTYLYIPSYVSIETFFKQNLANCIKVSLVIGGFSKSPQYIQFGFFKMKYKGQVLRQPFPPKWPHFYFSMAKRF